MALFSTLFVTCVLVTYMQLVTTEEVPSPRAAGADPGKQSEDTVMHCEDMQETTCKSTPEPMPDMVMAYKGCTHNSGSVQVTLHCCIPGVASSEGCLSHLVQARNCTSTGPGGIPSLVCEIKQHDASTPIQQPEAPNSQFPSRNPGDSDSSSGNTVMHCDDTQETICKSVPQPMPDMVMAYKGCTHNSGSVQVTLHCCIPGVGSSEGCLSHLVEPKKCTSTVGIPSLVCELTGDSQALVTTSTQPAPPGSHSPSREEESDSISGVTIGLIAGLAGAIVFAVVVILVVFRVCRQKRLVTEDAEKTIPAGFGSKEWEATKSKPYGDIGDDGYMDIKALDREKEKPQDN